MVAINPSDYPKTSPKVHSLKSWPEFFNAIKKGFKRHELRRLDRDFTVGDVLELCEFDPEKAAYTGRKTKVFITYITSVDNPCALSKEGLSSGFCILSIAPLT